MKLEDYLTQKLAPSTAKRYQIEIEHFFLSLENQNNCLLSGSRDAKKANHTDIINYLTTQRKTLKNLNVTLSAIKHFYIYLLQTNQRQDNPANSIKLRDKRTKDIQVQDLFTTEELALLLERTERYSILKNRNKIIITLLIYQGLTVGEIKQLEIKDIDLEQGTLYIKPGRKTNRRTLKLQPNQVFLVLNYLQKDREELLQKTKSETNKLILNKLGKEESGEGINYLIETKKHLFPNRNLNPRTIRQSVITNLLKQGKDLRLVQTFAGHKYPSSTEKYKQTEVEELKNQILKYHPLDN